MPPFFVVGRTDLKYLITITITERQLLKYHCRVVLLPKPDECLAKPTYLTISLQEK
jgi:hypothetical protein